MAVQKIPIETVEAIKRKSAYSLPDRPSDQGVKADEIKKALWTPIVDSGNSVVSEINRVVDEINEEFDALPEAYVLPVAKPNALGGIKASAKPDDSNYNEVYIGKDEKLYVNREVPTPTESDNGKILTVIDGALSYAKQEDGGGIVPTPTDQDNGKILRVQNGSYMLADPGGVSTQSNSAGGTTYEIETIGG